MSSENISGLWTGIIIFDESYGDYFQNKELYFEMEVTHKLNEVSGFANDTGGVFPSPDPALITGQFNGRTIKFIKQYLSLHSYEEDVLKIDKSTLGPEIYYDGEYDEYSRSFSGKWTFEEGKYFSHDNKLNWYVGSGKWTMKRKD